VIRKARPADLPAIRRIYNEAVAERASTADEKPRSLADRRKWLKQFDARHPIYVGIEDGEVAAYGCLFSYGPKSGYRFTVENSVYVAGEHRGKGWGTLMLDHLLSRARSLKHRYIWARIFTHNNISVRLHRKAGFRLVGVQKRVAVLDGKWYDVALLEKHL
jgi:phosphinothricin acetyltransferase